MNITQLSRWTDGPEENTGCLSNGEVALKEVFLKSQLFYVVMTIWAGRSLSEYC